MAGLDEVSQQIGRLTALVETTNGQVGALFRKFDDNNRELIEHAGVIKHLGKAFAKHGVEDAKAHVLIAEVKSDLEAIKNKGKGFSVGLTLVGGGGGLAGIWAALQALFGGGSPPAH